jgi:hypothetical protein
LTFTIFAAAFFDYLPPLMFRALSLLFRFRHAYAVLFCHYFSFIIDRLDAAFAMHALRYIIFAIFRRRHAAMLIFAIAADFLAAILRHYFADILILIICAAMPAPFRFSPPCQRR